VQQGDYGGVRDQVLTRLGCRLLKKGCRLQRHPDICHPYTRVKVILDI
jgi:hypothetical protein